MSQQYKDQIQLPHNNYMRKFWQNNTTNQENNGKIKNASTELQQESTKLQQSLAELECEEAIIKEKKEFGRARKSVMNVLRAKYTDKIANRALNRVNKRLQNKFCRK